MGFVAPALVGGVSVVLGLVVPPVGALNLPCSVDSCCIDLGFGVQPQVAYPAAELLRGEPDSFIDVCDLAGLLVPVVRNPFDGMPACRNANRRICLFNAMAVSSRVWGTV